MSFIKIELERTVLFVGRTGNGKSSTANSLVREKFFGTKNGDFSLQIKTIQVEGSKFTVVDGTGIGDTGSDMVGGLQDTIQKAETAVRLCESGFNALIFVMTYGSRFTKQEKDAVDLIKSLFGRDIFRRFGIIVMTRGDQFNMDIENDPKTFDQWCREQTGAIKDFFQECDYRIVLFNNRSTNTDILFKQRQNLLNHVPNTNKYSLEDFQLASSDRNKLLLKQIFLDTEKRNERLIQDFDQQLSRAVSTKETKDRKALLTNLLSVLEKQMETIQETFKESEYYPSLWTPLQTRFLNVTSQLQLIGGGRNASSESSKYIQKKKPGGVERQEFRSLPEPSRSLSENIQRQHTETNQFDDANYSNSQQKMSPANNSNDKDKVLLFVGRTGNGKSSTANSLVREKFFGTKNGDFSLQIKTIQVEGSKFTVVDGTGIGDTGSDMVGGLQDTIQKAETAVRLCESGFNALIFVMTYGSRFTKQEKDAVDLIKSLFGRDIFRRFGIIVMTRGDQFNMDIENDPKTFDQWCREQTGAIKDFFQECDYRIVLFNNRSTNTDILFKQRQNLLNHVPNTNKYSLEDFQLAIKDRKILFINQSFQDEQKENHLFLRNIDTKIDRVFSFTDGNDKHRKKMLEDIRLELEKQIEKVENSFKGSTYYTILLMPLETKLLDVNTKLRLIESHRKLRAKSADLKRDELPSLPVSERDTYSKTGGSNAGIISSREPLSCRMSNSDKVNEFTIENNQRYNKGRQAETKRSSQDIVSGDKRLSQGHPRSGVVTEQPGSSTRLAKKKKQKFCKNAHSWKWSCFRCDRETDIQ